MYLFFTLIANEKGKLMKYAFRINNVQKKNLLTKIQLQKLNLKLHTLESSSKFKL